MNIKQWEEAPLSSASRKACVESVRRQYVETLTRDFVSELSGEELLPVHELGCAIFDFDGLSGMDFECNCGAVK